MSSFITGCDVSRLRDFITEFYSHPSSSEVLGQNVDDAFCAFIWSMIVQQPGVRVGTIPPGGSTEVYIAPQASAVRKAKAKGGEAVEDVPMPGLDIVEDAAVRPLEDLRQQYGDQLRIAVDPETTFAALTGSHIRVRGCSSHKRVGADTVLAYVAVEVDSDDIYCAADHHEGAGARRQCPGTGQEVRLRPEDVLLHHQAALGIGVDVCASLSPHCCAMF